MRLWTAPALLTLSVLTACVPAPMAFDPAYQPVPDNFGPNNVNTEWWYASGVLPESGLAFHWAQFKVNYRGAPYYTSHVAVTDLRGNTLNFIENNVQTASFAFPPLKLSQDTWTLTQEGAAYRLNAGPLKLTMTPTKAAVVHPPGYSGTPEVGRMYYQSITRLAVSGTVDVGGEAREARGTVWFDHQWGDQTPGRQALWDWFGLHLSDGSDLMLYRVRDGSGRVVQVAGSRVGADGVARVVPDVTMTPGRTWTSPSGRTYVLEWTITAPSVSLTVRPLRDDQELLSKTTGIAYWEGAVQATGTADGQPVTAQGMGEFVGGVLTRAEGPSIPTGR
ncbi:lipocalin family protein [uncultured Deinococcus sp.]|uniref:lipocalin family protein n=1 Tax=uncultured Deinococcus sp. TaxID=158789 RepID=UPI0025CFCB07|nr:lipocalin family protein [uncultured Deinococcus sp.]